MAGVVFSDGETDTLLGQAPIGRERSAEGEYRADDRTPLLRLHVARDDVLGSIPIRFGRRQLKCGLGDLFPPLRLAGGQQQRCSFDLEDRDEGMIGRPPCRERLDLADAQLAGYLAGEIRRLFSRIAQDRGRRKQAIGRLQRSPLQVQDLCDEHEAWHASRIGCPVQR